MLGEHAAEWAVLSMFILSFMAIGAWNGQHDRRLADRLREDGREVEAEIVDFQSGVRGIDAAVGAKAKVAFQAEGRQVETWVVVGTSQELGPTRVRYLRSDPSVARLATDLEPRSGAIVFYLIFYSLGGLLAWGIWRFLKEMDRQLGVRD